MSLAQFEAVVAHVDQPAVAGLSALARELENRGDAELLGQLTDGVARLLEGLPLGKPKGQPKAETRDEPFEFAWASVPDVSFASPRGNFSCDFGKGALGLRGKTGTHRVDASQVDFALSIPHKNGAMALVHLTYAQGASPLTLLATPKAAGKPVAPVPGPNAEGAPPTAPAKRDDVVLQLLSAALGRGIAPSKAFKSQRGEAGVACKLKVVTDGTLYPLDEGMLFVAAQVVFLAKKSVASAEIARSPSRTCVMRVVANGVSHEFSMIDEGELGPLQSYLASTRLGQQPRLSAAAHAGGNGGAEVGSSEEEDDDSSFEGSSSEESSSGSEDDEEANGQQGDEAGGENAVHDTEHEGTAEGSSNSSTSDDDDDGHSLAELVDEDPLQPDDAELIPSGVKRRRKQAE